MTYSFAILDGGPGSNTGQSDSSDPTATYEAPSDIPTDETVTIEVTVTDDNGDTDTDTVEITVEDISSLPAQFRIEGSKDLSPAVLNPQIESKMIHKPLGP